MKLVFVDNAIIYWLEKGGFLSVLDIDCIDLFVVNLPKDELEEEETAKDSAEIKPGEKDPGA